MLKLRGSLTNVWKRIALCEFESITIMAVLTYRQSKNWGYV